MSLEMEKKDNMMLHMVAMWMEGGEFTNLIEVWTTAALSLSYCYFVAQITPKGALRLLTFLPVVALFLFLPLNLHSVSFVGITSFFLSCLANFKILMLAFNEGPLSSTSNPIPYSRISLPQFLALACLPIKFKTLDKLDDHDQKSFLNYAIKGVVLVSIIVAVHGYSDFLHPQLVLFSHGLFLYLFLEALLAVTAAAARALLGVELEPQFNEPYLSSSLQDFWGHRWNIAVTRVLHPTVYFPVLEWSEVMVGRSWAPLAAVLATFGVSGVMHELIFYHMGRVRPTWEVTWFFLVHGVCVAVEVAVKRAVNDRWRLPRAVGTILTDGFVTVTGCWLFLPQFLRCKAMEKGLAEIGGAFIKGVYWQLR